MLIDTHCHLSFKAFNDSWPDVVRRARDKNVQMIAVGAAKATSEKSIAIAEASDGVFAAIGLHPTHAGDEQFDYDWFSKAADNPKVVAIGETGIDYYHLDDTHRHPSWLRLRASSERSEGSRRLSTGSFAGAQDDGKRRAVILQKQEDLLRRHLTIARDKNLPVVLHSRDSRTDQSGVAYEHLYRIIKDFGYFHAVLHCFGGDWTVAQKFLKLGCLISFTGIVTYKNANESLKEVVRKVPLDRFMLETDSPYLAPEPYRGKQNEPVYVEHIARAIAEMRGTSYDEIAQATTENAKKFFGL